VGTIPAGVCAHFVCIGTTLTTAADWDIDYISTTTITGTGANVLAVSPSLTTPSLGVATATSINGLTITSSTGTLTVTNAKTLSVSNTLTFTGTDSSSVAFGAGGTVLYSGGALGTPSSGTLTNCTFPTLNQNTTGSAATFTSTSQNSQFNSVGVGTAGSGTAGEIRATNQITAYYSDDRLKTRTGNIQNALEKVLSLDGFHYYANETAVALGYDASKQEVGLSAQQVQAILPEVIAPAPIDPQYMTMHYERLVPLLVEAIKEQQKQIEELKAKLGN
jgi:hypothetical protein